MWQLVLGKMLLDRLSRNRSTSDDLDWRERIAEGATVAIGAAMAHCDQMVTVATEAKKKLEEVPPEDFDAFEGGDSKEVSLAKVEAYLGCLQDSARYLESLLGTFIKSES
jgi:hypothetical protein